MSGSEAILADTEAPPTDSEVPHSHTEIQPSQSEQNETASSPTSETPGITDSPQVKPKLAKVEVLLKATGDAPIMKKKKWALEQSKKIGFIIEFIKKLIKLDSSDSLFLYVNQSFAPAPDTEVGTLYECFGSDGKLILHYCRTQAWG